MYALTHAHAYRRIDSVAEAMGKLRVLDLTNEEVRQAIAESTNAAVLFRESLINSPSPARRMHAPEHRG